MFKAGHWNNSHWAQKHFFGGGHSVDTPLTTTLSMTWKFGGVVFANQTLDYVVKSGNTPIAWGTGTTNSSGVLSIDVPYAYHGMALLTQVENVGDDMVTTGKVYGAQVAVAA